MGPEFVSPLSPGQAVPGEVALRQRLLIYLWVFAILEVAFITLAVVCLNNPLPCSLSSSVTFTKAIFTIFFIAWQAVAAMCAREVVLHGFSSEWYFRLHKTGGLSPGHTDLVSTATSGFWDKIRYFFSRSPSITYRLSFVAFWILVALAGVAPGSMSVDSAPRFVKTTINITNFARAAEFDIDTTPFDPWLLRAFSITHLELSEGSVFGFHTKNGVVVGWPDIGAGQLMGDMEFESDVLLFDMKCWWEAPSFNNSQWNTTWYAGGYAWYPWSSPPKLTTFDGGMVPMYRFSTEQEFMPDNFPSTLPAADPIGLSGYIFFGHNSSFLRPPSAGKRINLDGLPTTFNDLGFHTIDVTGDDGYFKSPLATFLLCDPQARILDGMAFLSQVNSTITVNFTSPLPSGNPKVGNIPVDTVNEIFGLSQLESLDSLDQTATMRIGDFASRVFLNDTSFNFNPNPPFPLDAGIRPLESIQGALESVFNAVAKAYSSYDRNFGVDNLKNSFLVPVPGAVQQNELELVTNRGLLLYTICLFFIATTLLTTNFFYLNIWRNPPFKLVNLIGYIEAHQQENDNAFSAPSSTPNTAQAQPRWLLVRLAGFVLIETTFFSLVVICSKTPIIVPTRFLSTEVKGSFIVIFILCQILAAFLLSDATAHAFSREWSFQRTRTGRLIPGVTDRVSRLTSGNNDKTRYFFTNMPSVTFRVAFLISLVLIALRSFAPGTLSISTVKAGVKVPTAIADLHLLNSWQTYGNMRTLGSLVARAGVIFILEQVEASTFWFDVEPNWVTAWPGGIPVGLSALGGIEYPTDVVHFNYSCSWSIPAMSFHNGSTTWTIDDQSWKLWSTSGGDQQYCGGILPLYRDVDVQPDGLSALLFVGSNESFPVNPDETKCSTINLDNLPTLLHPSGLQISRDVYESEPSTSEWISPLSTLLLCNPQIELSGGGAKISAAKKLTVTASGLPPVGNMPPDAVNTIFAYSMLNILYAADLTAASWFGSIGAQAFLPVGFRNLTMFPQGVPVHDVSIVNENMNKFALSASKAFLDGVRFDPDNWSNVTQQTIPVVGLREVDKPALVGDKTLGLVSLYLSIATTLGFAFLVWLLYSNPGATFELKNIIPALQDMDVKLT